MIQDGKKVKFNFTLHADGKLIESTKGTPFEYTHGRDNIFSGLKKGLEGMKEKEEKTIVLSPPKRPMGNMSMNFTKNFRGNLWQETLNQKLA